MHALHFKEVIARGWPTVPARTPEVEEVELQDSFRLRSKDLRPDADSKRETKLRSAQPGWRGHEVARHPGPVATVWPSLSAG